ncbi:putative integral membrane protein [Mycetocola reblochoni REB411]|uniref:Putative integral membrane protein n=1 Tax=Mycetocola reblochoni REB411 TaxID=1255698 RepID=A0A1R4JLK3_9MICO|nr:putative integral membrane protein [Mycetocola reblochoni REB411]
MFDDDATVGRRIDESVAGPRASARIILGAPVVAIAMATALGNAPLSVLLGSVLGWTAILSSALLCLIGWRWSRLLIDRVSPSAIAPETHAVLTAVAIEGGADSRSAVARASTACRRFDLDIDDGESDTEAVIRRASGLGVPVVALLRADAESVRRARASAATASAAALAPRMLLPLGLCALPAFILVGIVPSILSVVGAGFGGGAGVVW